MTLYLSQQCYICSIRTMREKMTNFSNIVIHIFLLLNFEVDPQSFERVSFDYNFVLSFLLRNQK